MLLSLEIWTFFFFFLNILTTKGTLLTEDTPFYGALFHMMLLTLSSHIGAKIITKIS